MSEDSGATLAAVDLHFSYGGNQVLRGLSFAAEPESVLGLVGPNGAGKTTTMDVLTGVRRPASGAVMLEAENVTKLSAHRRAAWGLARTYQHVKPLRHLTVAENVMVGLLYGRHRHRSVASARKLAHEYLERVNLTARADVAATQVSTGQQKLMDLARALAMQPRVLLMDEPLAALSSTNRDLVMRVVSELRDQGCAVVLIEHVMRAVLDVADRLIVVTNGAVLAEGPPNEIVMDPRVVEAYLGPGFTVADREEMAHE